MAFAADVRAVLAEPGFGRLFGTRLLSQGADGVFQASLASAVLFNPQHTTDAASAAAGFSVLLLPYSLVGPFAGVFLDRWRRQRVLARANLVRAGIVLGVAGLLVTVGPGSALFYGLALAAVSVNRFYLAALSAALPHVVAARRLVTANGVATTSGLVATIAGGGLALPVRAALGHGDLGSAAIAVTAAIGYLASAGVARRFPAEALGPDRAVARAPIRDELVVVLRGLGAGARHVAARRPALYALLAIAAHRFCYGLSTIATLLLYRNYFTGTGLLPGGLVGLGEVFAVGALGTVLAAAVTPAVTTRWGKPRWIAVVFAGAGVTEIALGLPYTTASFVAAAFFLGFAAQASKICVDTIVQESVEESFRGRVFSFYDTLFNLTFVSAAVVGAVVLPPSGRSYGVLVGIAAGYVATSIGYATATRREGGPDRAPVQSGLAAAQRRSSSTAAS